MRQKPPVAAVARIVPKIGICAAKSWKFHVKAIRLVKLGVVRRRYRPVKQMDLPLLVTLAPRHRRSGSGAVEQQTARSI